MKNRFTAIGGQAVIEGVLMKSPGFIAIAVRKNSKKIALRTIPHISWTKRSKFSGFPVIRGVVTLFEALYLGVEALGYSAQVASEEEGGKERMSSIAILFSILLAFVLGMALFVVLPHFLTVLFTSGLSVDSLWFHLLDGLLRACILMIYVYLISWMKDIRRVFQYHGAEHKTIYAFEKGEALLLENARKHGTLHPRCGTSFLLFLVFVSILVFSVIFPYLGMNSISSVPVLSHALIVLVKILLMIPVAGLAYELIKISASKMDNPFFKAVIWPGMVLQRLTTREPTDDQLEVALVSLRQVLNCEKQQKDRQEKETEIEISNLSDLGEVSARVDEFLEA